MKKHTPGPWVIAYDQGDYPYVISEQSKGWKNPIVCNLYEDVTPEDSVTVGPWLKAFDNAQANAKLIASAPEMLEALEILLIQFGEYKDGEGAAKYHAVNIAKQAIAKAKGEA